ncbi:hypothetical protein Hanom_Chr14g01292731 [Helianthus anomalus]
MIAQPYPTHKMQLRYFYTLYLSFNSSSMSQMHCIRFGLMAPKPYPTPKMQLRYFLKKKTNF